LYSAVLLGFILSFFIIADARTTYFSTLSLHDALPISGAGRSGNIRSGGSAGIRLWPGGRARPGAGPDKRCTRTCRAGTPASSARSEEHTSELQSRENLVCRLLLEKKKK